MTAATAAMARPQNLLELYRDDGPLARALGAALGRRVRVAPLLLVAAAAAPLAVVVVLGGDDVARPAVAAVVAWLVVLGGLSHGRPHLDRFAWAVPALLRLVEYGGLLWLAALARPAAEPAAFALLAALAFRHYDIVYRQRYQGVAPPPWVGLATGGWDGRLLAGFALLATGALPAGFYVAAALLAAVFVGESVAGWTRLARAQRPTLYSEEEDEAE
jgi:hypothetical protein